MAKQKGVYGSHYTGQLGKAVVGSTWKDQKVLRTYSVPTNPNTAGQQAQRAKFKLSQVVASNILQLVIWPYWNPFANSQSGFNAFIGYNSQVVTGNDDFINIRSVVGSYEGVAQITTATYNATNGDVDISWPTAPVSIGDSLDREIALCLDFTEYDPDDKTPIVLAYLKDDMTRGDGFEQFNIRSGLTPSDIFVYLGMRQPATDSVLKIGTSVSKQCVAL